MMIVIFVLFVFSAWSQCIIHPLGSRPPSQEEPSCPAYSPNHAIILVIPNHHHCNNHPCHPNHHRPNHHPVLYCTTYSAEHAIILVVVIILVIITVIIIIVMIVSVACCPAYSDNHAIILVIIIIQCLQM